MKRFFYVILAIIMATVMCFDCHARFILSPGSQIKGFPREIQEQAAASQQQQKVNIPPPPPTPFVPQRTIPEIRGCIKLGDASTRIPEFRVLFDGKEAISNKEGFFSFTIDNEDKNFDTYSLIVCKNVTQKFDKTNTLKNVGVIPNKDYLYYSFHHSFGSESWKQQEEHLNKKDLAIPSHCVVVLIDPKYVDRVEQWNISLPNNIRKLPVIVLKNDVDRKKIAHASAKSLLYSLDTTVFHEPVKETIQKQANNDKVIVSLAQ
jgi:heat shock protein HspQ